VAAPATQTMYGADGSAVEVPVDQVADAYRSGQLGLRDDQQVFVQRGGEVVAVSGAEAGALFEGARGATTRVATPEAYARQEEAREYGGVGGTIAAGAAGVGRGLTLGLSDLAARELGYAPELERLERYNPTASLVGEGLGMLAPLALSGGAAGAAEGASVAARVGRAATAVPRVVGGVGEAAGAVGRGLVRGLGAAEGGLLARGAETAARFGAEGALYGVGEAVSRAAIHDEELTAEKLVGAAGHGFALGAAGGAALVGAGALGRAALGKGLDVATGLAESAVGRAEAKATQAAKAAETLDQKVTKLADTLTGGLDQYAVNKTLKSTGTNQKILEEIEAAGEAVKQRAAQQIREQLPELIGKKEGAILSHAEQAEAATKNVKKWGKKIGDKLDDLDRIADGAKPDVSGIVNNARERILKPLAQMPGAEATGAAIEKYLVSFEEKAQGKGFSEVHKMRAYLDDIIYEGKRAGSAGLDSWKALRGVLEEELLRSGEQAAVAKGSSFVAEYAAAKDQYRAAKWVEKATEKGAVAEARNRTLGLSEQLGVLGGSNALGSALGAVLGPAGQLAGNVVGGAGAALLQNLTRRYGDQIAAEIATRATKTDMVRAVTSTLDDAMSNKLSKFFGRTKDAAKSVPLASPTAAAVERAEQRKRDRERPMKPAEEFKRNKEALASYLASPQKGRAIADGVEGVSPTLAAKTAAVQQRAAEFLHSKLPSERTKQSTLQPQFDKSRPSPSEMAKWNRYWKALDDPASVVEDLRKGTISREAVEALRHVYPKTYEQLQQAAMIQLGGMAKQLPYDKARALGVLLDIPAVPTQQPAFVAAVQATYQSTNQQAQTPAAPQRPVHVSQAYSLDNREE
jgi:hypothetical protein